MVIESGLPWARYCSGPSYLHVDHADAYHGNDDGDAYQGDEDDWNSENKTNSFTRAVLFWFRYC